MNIATGVPYTVTVAIAMRSWTFFYAA